MNKKKTLYPHPSQGKPKKVLDSIQSHKLLYCVNELQAPVFKEVKNILHHAICENTEKRTRSECRLPKYSYLQNDRALRHQYRCQGEEVHQRDQRLYTSPTQPSTYKHRSVDYQKRSLQREKIQEKKLKIKNPESSENHVYESKRQIIEKHPKISEFGISRMNNLEGSNHIERLHQKLDAYIKANIY